MYTIVPTGKKPKPIKADYMFKDFEQFYELAKVITVQFSGAYTIVVSSDKVEEIREFVRRANDYSYLNIFLYVPKSVVDYMLLYNPQLNVEEARSQFEILKELISRESLLFDKNVLSLLYASIDHDYESMDEAVRLLKDEFGSHHKITEQMLGSVIMINKVTFPRTVLLAYLRMERYRKYKLNKCLQELGGDVTLGAFVKNIKALFEEKVKFFKSGVGSDLIKSIDTQRLNLMYRVFVVDRCGVNDICLLLELYERGISTYDIVQRESN